MKELKEKLTVLVIAGMYPAIIMGAQVLDLCMHCPGH